MASRVASDTTEERWDATTRGGYWGHLLYLQIIRLLGPRVATLLLAPVVTFYLLVAGEARRASMQYLARVLGPATWFGRWARSWRHFMAFATAYLDGTMLSVHGTKIFHTEHLGSHHVREIAAGGQGGVMLTGHMGTWELSVGMLDEKHGISRVAIVMFKSDAAQLQGFIEKLHGRRPRVIAVGDGELASLDIIRAVRDGELVAMQGDRTVDTHDVVVPFFGADARWPVGPWVVAAVTGAPLLWSFAMRVGPRHYHFLTDPPRRFRFERGRPRDEQLKEWVKTYVTRIEELLRQHPYQWYNFFDFWAAGHKLPARRPQSPVAPPRP
ncbi:MAG: hypothetical protein JNK82_33850 [Myxococcaceae bacterium]|nr:hypothetical protein [Myxococcaceae bacterium]